jgi:MSHA pilin protein MshA
MTRNKGFTLIELITVIAILGALAVIALPRFINLQDEARDAAVQGVAGSLSAGTATNLAGALAGDATAITLTDCTNAGQTLSGGAVPASYSIQTAALATTTGDSTDCTVVLNDGAGNTLSSATFQAYAVPDAP